MTVDLKALREKAQAATPGPWYTAGLAGRQQIWARRPGYAGQYCLFDDAFGYAGPGDSSFVAAADPQTVLALVDAVEALRLTPCQDVQYGECADSKAYDDFCSRCHALAVFTDEATT